MSIVSGESRYSRLSRRSSSRKALSTLEREQAEMQMGRLELQALMRHNEQSYKHAINYPELRRGHHSLDLTVPKEFNLSCSRRPVVRSEGDDARTWTTALRKPSVPDSPGRGRGGWAPELTVPQAPTLRTASRQRSTSASRSDSRQRSMSKHSLPREQAAIERHLYRSTAAATAGSAEERAERARAEAQARHEEALAEEKKRLCVFRPAKGKATGSLA